MADSLLSDSVVKGISITSIVWIFVIIAVVFIVAQIYMGNLPLLRLQSMTMAQRAANKEGFFGGVARGAGHPDCLRNLNEGPELLGIVQSAAGTADYSELQLIIRPMKRPMTENRLPKSQRPA